MSPTFMSPGINLPVREVGIHKGIKEVHFSFVIAQHCIIASMIYSFHSMYTCVGWIMVPKNVHAWIPGNLVRRTSQMWLGVRIPRWEGYLGWSGWAGCHHRETKWSEREKAMQSCKSRTEPCGAMSQGRQDPSRNRNRQGNGLSGRASWRIADPLTPCV